jgi:hypothetical protein
MEPNWGNTHAPTCPVAQARPEIWEEFCQRLHLPGEPGTREFIEAMAHRDEQWGIVIEYTAGGDEDVEACECHVHHSEFYKERYKDLIPHQVVCVWDNMGKLTEMEVYGTKLNGERTWVSLHFDRVAVDFQHRHIGAEESCA